MIIPESVTCIKEGTFGKCKGLKEVSLPESIMSIDKMAFYDCSKLESINIPDSVTEIGDNAFYGCEELTFHCSEDSFARRYAEENEIKNSENENIVYGDINADGALNTADLTDVIRIVISQSENSKLADINRDGTVDVSDILVLKKILAK